MQLVPEQTITSVTKKDDQYQVETSGGNQFLADGVIAGLGITPSVELAQNIQLKTDNGIHVDRYLKTSDPFIWSAGDVTNYYSPLLEKRMRTEHEDAANTMGKLAGKNMGGAREHYTYLPYFYSDLFEIGYEAIGELGTHMEIVEDWHELYRKGVIYYLKDKQVRGAILWGIWDQIEKVRELIASRETFTRDELVGLIQA
ncbi:MAG: Anthranilate 1,2-dioxygenase system ferredoxin--NAD(+) reductase component [Chlamydiales bacterium]|nr:Anthranilate 1,2-dioxygenase system ferredoxin--NAD(+) reductase component [Chlamydiales bacterium]